MHIVETLITPEILMLAVAIVAILEGVGRLFKVRGLPNWRKVLPMLPLLLGVTGALMPGVLGDEPPPWPVAIMCGLWAGFLGTHGRKIIKRLVFDKLEGKD